MKKLSVIVPIYNTSNYLHQCLDSIINQTYKNLDIVLVDDGSTDNSGVIAEEYITDLRVRVVHTKNEGSNKARLMGAQLAIGEYITFVDSDDWIDQDMYEKLMYQITENHTDMILCGMNRFAPNHQSYNCEPLLLEGLYSEEDLKGYVRPQMFWNDKVGTNAVNASLWSKIIRKDILLKNLEKAATLGIYYGDDAAVLFPTMLDISSLYVTHKMFYHHRQRDKKNVAPYIKDEECVDKLFMLYQYLKEQLKERGYEKKFQNQLELYYMKLLKLRGNYLEFVENEDKSIFPFSNIQVNDKVVIYGAGKVGQTYMKQNEKYHFCEVILWVDKNYQKFDKELNISSPKELEKADYDYVVIAVHTPGLAREIKNELVSFGVSKDAIIWEGNEVLKLIN